MIQRPEEQGGVEAVIVHWQGPGVAQLGCEGAVAACGLHVPWHGINQQYVVASPSQGGGVQPAGTADVDDVSTCGHPLAHNLLGPLELQNALAGPADEAIALVELGAP